MQVLILAALVCVAAANIHPAPAPYHPPEPAYHPAPAPYHPKPAYHAPSKYEEEPTEPPKYSYQYGVQAGDHYDQAAYEHNEDRDYDKTVGSYRVELPDGRTQIVTYEDTGYGFVANVQYEGVAQYPPEKEYQPKHAKPAPYHPKPAPSYHPEPAYHPAPKYA